MKDAIQKALSLKGAAAASRIQPVLFAGTGKRIAGRICGHQRSFKYILRFFHGFSIHPGEIPASSDLTLNFDLHAHCDATEIDQGPMHAPGFITMMPPSAGF